MSTGTMDQVGVQVTDWNVVERVARELDALTRHTGPQGPCVHLVSAHHLLALPVTPVAPKHTLPHHPSSLSPRKGARATQHRKTAPNTPDDAAREDARRWLDEIWMEIGGNEEGDRRDRADEGEEEAMEMLPKELRESEEIER